MGALGVLVLYAMWFVHLLLFRGSDLPSSIGLLVVIQNIITSLFNSHLFDFHEGWMSVLGVGVACGMTIKSRSRTVEPREFTCPHGGHTSMAGITSGHLEQ